MVLVFIVLIINKFSVIFDFMLSEELLTPIFLISLVYLILFHTLASGFLQIKRLKALLNQPLSFVLFIIVFISLSKTIGITLFLRLPFFLNLEFLVLRIQSIFPIRKI